MREAVAAHDEATLRELASPAELPKLGPGSIFVIAVELWGDGSEAQADEVCRIFDQARQIYPGDFVLQAAAGYFYDQSDRLLGELAALNAAVGLRPADVTVRYHLAVAQYTLGHMDEAQDTLRACLAMDPTNVDVNYLLGVVQNVLGDQAGSLASLTRLPEIAATAQRRADIAAEQYLNELLDHDDYARRLDAENLLDAVATMLMPLADAADPSLRDPELVLRTLEERAPSFNQARWPSFVEALARLRLEDWAGADAILATHYDLPRLMVLTPPCYDFLRAVAAGRLGRDAEARGHYQRGLWEWTRETVSNPAAWERSDAARWKREAEAALKP
jgi:tetratricopeptide (TPR) repeat protein